MTFFGKNREIFDFLSEKAIFPLSKYGSKNEYVAEFFGSLFSVSDFLRPTKSLTNSISKLHNKFSSITRRIRIPKKPDISRKAREARGETYVNLREARGEPSIKARRTPCTELRKAILIHYTPHPLSGPPLSITAPLSGTRFLNPSVPLKR